MALDGIATAALTQEFRQALLHTRIQKISQPEPDEILLTIKGDREKHLLLLSASASLPLAALTERNRPAPLTAPTFCMSLRKHLTNGRIEDITQPSLERVIRITVSHRDEMGDLAEKVLILEMMGKHSNLIFCDGDGQIIDSIKHVNFLKSSVREVLPGRTYFLPQTIQKSDPLTATAEDFRRTVEMKPYSCIKAIYGAYTGISPVMASEICFRAGIDGEAATASLDEERLSHLTEQFLSVMEDVKNGRFAPFIYLEGGVPKEFSALPLTQYQDLTGEPHASISETVLTFYSEKDRQGRMRQKSQDLRKVVGNALERNRKKRALQEKQLKDTEKRDRYRLYGDLLKAYAYQIDPGEKEYTAEDWNTGEAVRIPLDPLLSPMDNALRYFDKYNKLKRTEEAVTEQLSMAEAEYEHLLSVLTSLDIAEEEADLSPIREELVRTGHLKKHGAAKKGQQKKSKPLHFLSSDGFDLYVGKNNLQNDELTFKLANANDWWFHAKKQPGSHVILRTGGKEPTDRSFEEAAALAAYYSAGRENDKVEIDYVKRKEVKKPGGAAPGFVVYYTNFSMTIQPGLTGLTSAE